MLIRELFKAVVKSVGIFQVSSFSSAVRRKKISLPVILIINDNKATEHGHSVLQPLMLSFWHVEQYESVGNDYC